METSLIGTLVYGYGVSGSLFDELLERQPAPEEQLQSSRDALLEPQRVGPLRFLVGWPGHAPHFGHRGEAVVEFGRVSAGLSRVAPRNVDAQPSSTRSVLARHMVLVVRARSPELAHHVSEPVSWV